MTWTVEHNPTSARSIVWVFPTDERTLHRLGSLQCPCHPEHELLPGDRMSAKAGVIGVMINHQQMATDAKG